MVTRCEEITKRLIELEHEKRSLLMEYQTLQKARIGHDIPIQHVSKQKVSQSRNGTRKDWFDKLGF